VENVAATSPEDDVHRMTTGILNIPDRVEYEKLHGPVSDEHWQLVLDYFQATVDYPIPQTAAQKAAETSPVEQPGKLGAIKRFFTGDESLGFPLMQLLGSVGTGVASQRAIKEATRKTAQSQARANLVNALSRRAVARGTEARPKLGLLGQLAQGVEQAGKTGMGAQDLRRQLRQQEFQNELAQAREASARSYREGMLKTRNLGTTKRELSKGHIDALTAYGTAHPDEDSGEVLQQFLTDNPGAITDPELMRLAISYIMAGQARGGPKEEKFDYATLKNVYFPVAVERANTYFDLYEMEVKKIWAESKTVKDPEKKATLSSIANTIYEQIPNKPPDEYRPVVIAKISETLRTRLEPEPEKKATLSSEDIEKIAKNFARDFLSKHKVEQVQLTDDGAKAIVDEKLRELALNVSEEDRVLLWIAVKNQLGETRDGGLNFSSPGLREAQSLQVYAENLLKGFVKSLQEGYDPGGIMDRLLLFFDIKGLPEVSAEDAPILKMPFWDRAFQEMWPGTSEFRQTLSTMTILYAAIINQGRPTQADALGAAYSLPVLGENKEVQLSKLKMLIKIASLRVMLEEKGIDLDLSPFIQYSKLVLDNTVQDFPDAVEGLKEIDQRYDGDWKQIGNPTTTSPEFADAKMSSALLKKGVNEEEIDEIFKAAHNATTALADEGSAGKVNMFDRFGDYKHVPNGATANEQDSTKTATANESGQLVSRLAKAEGSGAQERLWDELTAGGREYILDYFNEGGTLSNFRPLEYGTFFGEDVSQGDLVLNTDPSVKVPLTEGGKDELQKHFVEWQWEQARLIAKRPQENMIE
jgi:hypothetical protein